MTLTCLVCQYVIAAYIRCGIVSLTCPACQCVTDMSCVSVYHCLVLRVIVSIAYPVYHCCVTAVGCVSSAGDRRPVVAADEACQCVTAVSCVSLCHCYVSVSLLCPVCHCCVGVSLLCQCVTAVSCLPSAGDRRQVAAADEACRRPHRPLPAPRARTQDLRSRPAPADRRQSPLLGGATASCSR